LRFRIGFTTALIRFISILALVDQFAECLGNRLMSAGD
jgi:hypothetical protein